MMLLPILRQLKQMKGPTWPNREMAPGPVHQPHGMKYRAMELQLDTLIVKLTTKQMHLTRAMELQLDTLLTRNAINRNSAMALQPNMALATVTHRIFLCGQW